MLLSETLQNPNSGHSWKSWQHYYYDHAEYFDRLIEEYQLEHNIPISKLASKSPKQKRFGFSEAEDALLVEYIAKNDLNGQRKGLHLYNGLSQQDGKQYERTTKSWCHRYSKNTDYFDHLIDIYRRNHNLNLHLLSSTSNISSTDMNAPSTPRISNRPSAPKSARFTREEDMNLVTYLAEATSTSPRIGSDERKQFKTYTSFPKLHLWAASRSANSWFSRYTSNMAHFETLIKQYRLRNHIRTRNPGSALGKRKRYLTSPIFEESGAGEEFKDSPKGIAYRTRKRLHTKVSASRAADGDTADKIGDECSQNEDNGGYRRSKRLLAAAYSEAPTDDSDHPDDELGEEDADTASEENRSLDRRFTEHQREGVYPLSSPTMRVTRQHARNIEAQRNVQDNDDADDIIEVDKYLRECSVDSADSDTQTVPSPPSSDHSAARFAQGLQSDIYSGSRVRFASPYVSTSKFSTASSVSSETPTYVWRRVGMPRRRSLANSDHPNNTGVDTPYGSDGNKSATVDTDECAASVKLSTSVIHLRSHSSVRSRNITHSPIPPSHQETKRRTSSRLKAPPASMSYT
ncbi:hypothetical protein J3R30DRAFT_1805965 [Lentinula aciculospora]|uniref:DNA-binding protein RAP1 n=1 Tax=Lentinula aciculospora TaxID=153920 RepID=A0A9W9DSU4_9AGAR|nr:hypothetical protein J3R30DRAFT_1805965 [Lentinula aciculospora]